MEARDEVHKVLANEDARQIPFLIFANKQDLHSSLKKDEIIDLLGIRDATDRKPVSYVKVQESSAVKDIGLLEGFEWVVDKIVVLGE